jgi:hypothetical protein
MHQTLVTAGSIIFIACLVFIAKFPEHEVCVLFPATLGCNRLGREGDE